MKLVSDEDALKVIEKIDALDCLVYDDNLYLIPKRSSNMACCRAIYFIRLNRYDEAIKQLKISAEMAIAFDNRPDESKTTSLLLGEKTHKKTDFETADSRLLREILRDSWLTKSEFDAIRDTEEFKAIIKKLS